MKVATSLPDADIAHGSVVSIGNFDGLHLGHRQILKTVVDRARNLGLQSVAMTFSPHPIHFLAPDRAPHLISTTEQKLELMNSTGIDVVFVVPFDQALSRMSPEHFIREYLIEGLKARSVCVGANFNFGYRQRGTIQTLREFQSQFEVIEVPQVRVRGTIVSSSRVRELVAAGEVSGACRLLGRWIQIEGEIVSGAGRGRTMKVPTLNLRPQNELVPKVGVYVSRISLDHGPPMNGVTNVGFRPTFDETDLTIETFVLKGAVPDNVQRARLDFIYRLRDERKFESPAALLQQISIDVKRSEKFFRMLGRVQVEIYSRPGCHLCDDAKEIIDRVRRRVPFEVRVINIDGDPELENRYGELIPVVLVNGEMAFKYHVDEAQFEEKVKRLWNP
jgi:riboflavin kinase / FMN adenylyltransferase